MKESEYLLLLGKKFSGEITPNESVLLEQWLSQSSENQGTASRMQGIWDQAEGYGKTFNPDMNADFQKVMARIQPAGQVMRPRWGGKLLRAAAAVAILAVALWGWQHMGNATAETTVVAEGSTPKNVSLPDGSKVWLREGARLSYVSSWSGKERHVKLQGEGYFEVFHDPAHPFKIDLEKGGTVEVLGTRFDISQTENETSVLVRSGKVRFSPGSGAPGPVLTDQQKAVFNYTDDRVKVSAVNSLNELSWQTGGLEFINTPLQQVVIDLEKYYQVKINLRNPAMADCPYTAPLTRQPIEKVLESLSLAQGLKYRKTGEGQFELSGGVCR